MNAFPDTFCIIDTETSGMRPPFSRVIDLGIIRVEKGKEVERYQTLLMTQGHAIAAGATGYFGSQTAAALSEYQAANGIVPAIGYFGSITRAQMKAAGLAGIWW